MRAQIAMGMAALACAATTAAAQAAPGDPVIGRWAWYTSQLVWVTADGALIPERGGRGEWKLEDATTHAYRFSWDGGRWIDHVTLAGDAITGINTMGRSVSGHRVGDRIVGRYALADGSILTTAADGGAWSSRHGGGRWDAIDVVAGRYRLSWPGEQLTAEVALSADGLVLSGPELTARRLALALMGRWRWFNGADVVMRPDGSAGSADGQRVGAAWRAVDPGKRAYQIDWASTYVDDVVVSADGLRLDGKNDHGEAVSARREAPAVAGPWTWADDRAVTVGADGSLSVAGKRGAWDGWLLVDEGRRLHRFVWGTRGVAEDLVLSEDGRTLSTSAGATAATRARAGAKAKTPGARAKRR